LAESAEVRRVREILKAVKPLAAEYYQLTKKPLGVTGEVAEYVAADLLACHLIQIYGPTKHEFIERVY
jgi:hypothetical protein